MYTLKMMLRSRQTLYGVDKDKTIYNLIKAIHVIVADKIKGNKTIITET